MSPDGAVDGEEGADGVELRGEDLEDDEGEGELREGRAHVGALEGALGGADLDEPWWGGWSVMVVGGELFASRSCRYACLACERE